MSAPTIEEAIFAKLSGDPSVSALVGSRIYPVRMPDNAIAGGLLPCITYQRIATVRQHTLDRPSTIAESTFAIECWGRPTQSIVESKLIARAVQRAIDGFRGSILGIDVFGVLSQNESDQYEDEVDLYRTSQDYVIYHAEGSE